MSSNIEIELFVSLSSAALVIWVALRLDCPMPHMQNWTTVRQQPCYMRSLPTWFVIIIVIVVVVCNCGKCFLFLPINIAGTIQSSSAEQPAFGMSPIMKTSDYSPKKASYGVERDPSPTPPSPRTQTTAFDPVLGSLMGAQKAALPQRLQQSTCVFAI